MCMHHRCKTLQHKNIEAGQDNESKGETRTHRDSIAIALKCSVRLVQVMQVWSLNGAALRSFIPSVLPGLWGGWAKDRGVTWEPLKFLSLEQGYEVRPSCYCLCFQTAFVNRVASVSLSQWVPLLLCGSLRPFDLVDLRCSSWNANRGLLGRTCSWLLCLSLFYMVQKDLFCCINSICGKEVHQISFCVWTTIAGYAWEMLRVG